MVDAVGRPSQGGGRCGCGCDGLHGRHRGASARLGADLGPKTPARGSKRVFTPDRRTPRAWATYRLSYPHDTGPGASAESLAGPPSAARAPYAGRGAAVGHRATTPPWARVGARLPTRPRRRGARSVPLTDLRGGLRPGARLHQQAVRQAVPTHRPWRAAQRRIGRPGGAWPRRVVISRRARSSFNGEADNGEAEDGRDAHTPLVPVVIGAWRGVRGPRRRCGRPGAAHRRSPPGDGIRRCPARTVGAPGPDPATSHRQRRARGRCGRRRCRGRGCRRGCSGGPWSPRGGRSGP